MSAASHGCDGGGGVGDRDRRRPGLAAWLRDLALGMRLARSGGRGAWTRTAMTVVGVALGVALLLFAASVPNMYAAREERTAARTDLNFSEPPPRSDATVLVADADTTFRGSGIRGRLLQPEGSRAPLPPGVAHLPAAGEMVVSPALAERLDAREGELLRTRLPYRVVGEIGDAGLEGPGEYAFYAGSDRLAAGAPRPGSPSPPACAASTASVTTAAPTGSTRCSRCSPRSPSPRCCCRSPSSSAPRSASAARRATAGWPRCG